MNNTNQYERIIALGVDIQNDFCPGGALPVPDGDRVVPVFNRVAEWVRTGRGLVALTADWHPSVTTHFDQWPVHCVAGTPGADFHPDLVVKPQDKILRKGNKPGEDAYSGFEGQTPDGMDLDVILKPDKAIRQAILVGGLATDYCVKATVLDACEKAKDWQFTDIYVIEDAVAAVNLSPGDEDQAKRAMTEAGARLINSHDLIEGRIIKGIRA